LNHPIITKVAWRLMPTVIICYFFACFDRANFSLAKFQLQDALTLSDTADGWGASLFVIAGARILGGGVVPFMLPSGLRAKEGSA
jgi:sugar phosphate permease